MAEFRMPSLGADMVSGRLLEWHTHPGDTVHRGDIIADVDTDKGVIEVEVFADGVVDRLLVEPGQKVPVGTVLAVIRENGSSSAAQADAGEVGPVAQPVPSAPAAPRAAPVAPPRRGGRKIRASPLARRVAAERGVDLATVTGTGANGVIVRADVERAAGTAPPAVPGASPQPAAPPSRPTRERSTDAMRRAIAAAMTRSKREIPHYYLTHTVDLGAATAWLAAYNRDRPADDRLLIGAVLLKATAHALRDVPELNAWYVDDRAVPKPDIHIGVAIALKGGGLVAPALHHTDRLELPELSRRLRALVARARTGALRSSEVTDPTITVTSLGDRGVDTVVGVIYPPQVALVGFGTVRERPWLVDGGFFPRPLVNVSLSADHRVSDGHRGALFLAGLAERLGAPEAL